MTQVNLSPDQRQFVEANIANGRYANADEVIAHALDVLNGMEARRAEFLTMLQAVDAQAEIEGCITIEELDREMTEIIARAAGTH